MSLHFDELDWQPDSARLFTTLRDLPFPAWLDSAQPWAGNGRYDILAAAPNTDTPPVPGVEAPAATWRSYFDSLAQYHREHYVGIAPAVQRLPFCGGLLGYLGYEPGNALHAVAHSQASAVTTPAAQIGAYDWCLIQDHLLRRSVLVSLPWVSPATRRALRLRLQSAQEPVPGNNFKLLGSFTPSINRDHYRAAFARIQDYIQAGDCYQVNLAQRFEAPYSGDPFTAYQILREVAAAPFSGYLQLADQQALLCLSPERFLSLQGQQVETRPIKGTRPRFADPARDLRSARELRNSPKDRAENLMIVDLLRNDLGHSCVPGSIHVDQLFSLETYPTVHHLVSTIRGELAPDRG
ncbi:MAG: anthranilate synthase component I family protein, partial [Haliea sp.]